MKAIELPFNFCPSCGSSDLNFNRPKKMSCSNCGFSYYQNNAAAVAVIIETEKGILCVNRANEPGKGMMDLPGGFIDPGENAEQAAIREIFEELQIKIVSLKYITSAPNRYPFKGTLYNTCDLFFSAKTTDSNPIIQQSEIQGWQYITQKDFKPEEIAFTSVRKVLTHYFSDLKR